MIHLVVCGHGEFATGLRSGVQALGKDFSFCEFINFKKEMSAGQLREALDNAVDHAGDTPVLFLIDILSGTPFRECVMIAEEGRRQIEVVSGVNLQMLLAAAAQFQETDDPHELAADLISNTRDGITILSKRMVKQSSAELEIEVEEVNSEKTEEDHGTD